MLFSTDVLLRIDGGVYEREGGGVSRGGCHINRFRLHSVEQEERMPIINGTQYEYQANPVHRNATVNKSQWTISDEDEITCFSGSIQSNWGAGEYFWGLHTTSAPGNLGLDRDHSTPVFIARFEGKSLPQVWHGYPINYRDQPVQEDVLKVWLLTSVLPPAKISKIIKRKKCAL
jgi:hypothetical protein